MKNRVDSSHIPARKVKFEEMEEIDSSNEENDSASEVVSGYDLPLFFNVYI